MTVSLHVPYTLESITGYMTNRLTWIYTGPTHTYTDISAASYDTIDDIVSAIDATAFNQSSISDDGYVTIGRSFISYYPDFYSLGPEDNRALCILWELLGFESNASYSLALSHTAQRHPKYTVWFDHVNLLEPNGRQISAESATGTRGGSRVIVTANVTTKAVGHSFVNATQYNALREWYSVAGTGAKVTLNVDGTKTEWVLDEASLGGLGSILRRTQQKSEYYELSLALRSTIA